MQIIININKVQEDRVEVFLSDLPWSGSRPVRTGKAFSHSCFPSKHTHAQTHRSCDVHEGLKYLSMQTLLFLNTFITSFKHKIIMHYIFFLFFCFSFVSFVSCYCLTYIRIDGIQNPGRKQRFSVSCCTGVRTSCTKHKALKKPLRSCRCKWMREHYMSDTLHSFIKATLRDVNPLTITRKRKISHAEIREQVEQNIYLIQALNRSIMWVIKMTNLPHFTLKKRCQNHIMF